MPNRFGSPIPYLGLDGTFADYDAASLYYPGALGQRTAQDGREYQLVRLDSGAVAAADSGVVAANDLAYWKDKSSYLVTNEIAQALGAEDATQDNKRNFVAGVFLSAITAGNHCFIQQAGRASVLAASGGTYNVGNVAIAADSAVSDINTVAAGTAASHTQVGLVAGARASGSAPVDLLLPGIP